MKRMLLLVSVCLFLGPALGRADDKKAESDVDRLEAKGLLRLNAHEKHVTALAFSPNGRVLASAGVDGWICLWNVTTGEKLQRFQAHDGKPVYGLSYSPDGKLLASAGADHRVRLWEPASGKLVRQLEGHKDKVVSVAFSLDGKLLATGGYDSIIRLWNPITGQELRQLKGHKKRVTSVAFSPDCKQLVSGGVTDDPINTPGGGVIISGWADQLRLWSVGTGEGLPKIPAKGFIASFSADGRTIAGAGLIPQIEPDKDDPKRTLIDGQSRIAIVDMATGHTLRVIKWRGDAAAFSPDGGMVASGCGCTLHLEGYGSMVSSPLGVDVYRLTLWDNISGRQIMAFPEEGFPRQIIFSPSGHRIAAGNFEGEVLLWNLLAYCSHSSPEFVRMNGKALWKEFGSDDAGRAYKAIWTLAASGNRFMPTLKDRLKPIPQAAVKQDEKQVRRWLADLGDPRFAPREAAATELRKLGRGIEPLLLVALRSKPALDTRTRLEVILRDVRNSALPPDQLRALRAIAALELIGSPQARELLEELAKGSPYALETQHAGAAFRRLEKRLAVP